MRIAIGSDHRGYDLKQMVISFLKAAGHEYQDFGVYNTNRADYPTIAGAVGEAVAARKFERGILICGTGIGMCIAANKVHGIRAAVAYNEFSACRMRQHNDVNVLCLGGESNQMDLPAIVNSFLACKFEGGRYQERNEMIEKMENA